MTANGWCQIFLFLALVLLVTKPMGIFITRVFNREKTFLDPVLGPIERLLRRMALCIPDVVVGVRALIGGGDEPLRVGAESGLVFGAVEHRQRRGAQRARIRHRHPG